MKISLTKGEQLEVAVDGATTYRYPPPAPRGKGEYPSGPRWRGINHAGAEYGEEWNGWTGQTFFAWTADAKLDAELSYLAGLGFNLIRLPIAWERLQRRLGGPFCAAYIGELLRVSRRITARGFGCVVDLHNYNRFATGTHVDDQSAAQKVGYVQHTLGDGTLKNEHLVDVWGRLAAVLKDTPLVQLELMNESHDFPITSDAYVAMVNEQIAAIRAAGATNVIHVPNSRGSDCDHFFADRPAPNGGSHDTIALLNVKDPAGKIVFAVHQYLHAPPKTATDLRDLVIPVTRWAEANGRELFLGEFGVDPSWPLALENVRELLAFVQASPAWAGWSTWNLSPYRVTDASGVADGPLMATLKPFLPPHTV